MFFRKQKSVAPAEYRFRPNFGQVLLAIWCLIILATLTFSTFDSSRTAFKEASVLKQAEAPAASLIFTQRESLVYAARVGEWLGGTIPRRQVQIARALLAQRLNVVSNDGTTTGQLATPEFIDSLRSMDQIVDSAKPGILSESDQHRIFKIAQPFLNSFIASARDVVVQYQQAIDIQLNTDAKQRASSSQQNLFLLYALLILGGLLIGWSGLTLVRQYKKAQIVIEQDTLLLENSQTKLQELSQTLEQKRIEDQRVSNERDSMRSAARSISISIREFSDNEEMAQEFCARIAEVFGSELVAVSTFPDDRFSRISASWTSANHIKSSGELALDEFGMQNIISKLWEESSLLYLDENNFENNPKLSDLSARHLFKQIMESNGFKQLLLLPIGEGTKGFGYVLAGSKSKEIEWDEFARQTMQFLSAHLAYSIIESELLATQRVVEQLEQLNEAKNDFISTVNHELRTPLTSIIGYIDLLKDLPRGAVNEQAAKFLNTLDRNAQALLDLVESMLALSRLDSREEAIAKQEVDVHKIVSNSIFVCEPAAYAKQITIRLTPEKATSDYSTSGNAGQLSQVFINLISNSIKFSPFGSEILVSIEKSNDPSGEEQLRIAVKDTGIGIPQNDIKRLFTRFFRAQNAVDGQHQGTGLGLAIVERIVTLHGGFVEVESVLGQGTTMIVQLPSRKGMVDQLIASRREGVLKRAILALKSASIEDLYGVSHEMAGSIGMYSFEAEGEKLKEYSHWLRNNQDAPTKDVQERLAHILEKMQVRLDQIQER